MEANSNRANDENSGKEDTTEEYDDTERVVGETSENVETSTASRGVRGSSSSETAPDCLQHVCTSSRNISEKNNQVLRTPDHIVKPKTDNIPVDSHILTSPDDTNDHISINSVRNSNYLQTTNILKHEIKQEPVTNDLDTVYGTYDEATNCITIICTGEDDVAIQECIQEVSSDDSTHLTPKYSYKDYLSPGSTLCESLSPVSVHSEDSDGSLRYKHDDCGYESHDEPRIEKNPTIAQLADPWHESFSILFPSLA